jgi:hypothetical protein
VPGWDKAQEWCKACGGLWEGWKTGIYTKLRQVTAIASIRKGLR